MGLGTAVGYLNLDVSGFARGVDSAISDMNRLNGNFNTASQGLQTIGGMFTKTGTALTAGFTAPVAGFAAASVKAGTDFDASMAKVAAVSKATGKDLEIIRDRAIEMGEKTRYSATEVSDAMYYMGLAGWDAEQIYKGIPGVLALGAASGEDLSRVSDIVTDSLTAFGMSAEDTTEFVNVLAEASRSSNTTVDQLGESFKYVGPVAGAFGYSIQDTATVLGIFANNGVKGSQAGTGLRQALNSLINPSKNAAELMDKYGVSLFNADGSTKTLMTVCEELRGTFGGLAVDIHNADGEVMTGEEIMEKYGHSLPTTEMEKLSAVVKIFGVRALPGMLSVINSSAEDFYSLSNSIDEAQDVYSGLGTAFGMQETMLDNLQGDWYLFTSALGTTKILISDMAKGALRDLVQSLTELINKFNELDPIQREQIVKWGLIAASIGPTLVIIGKLISGIGNMIKTFSLLKGAFTFIGTGIKGFIGDFGALISLVKGNGLITTLSGLSGISPIFFGIVAAVTALVAAFVNLWKNNEEFRNKIIEIWEGVKVKFEEFGQRIVEIFNQLGFSFESFKDVISAGLEVLKIIWDGFCELLAPVFVGVFEYLKTVLSGWIDFFVGVFEVIVGVIRGFRDGDWSMVWEGIGDIVKSVVDTIVGILDVLAETIWNVIQTIANWLGADWSMSWQEAKNAVADWFESVVQWVSDLVVKIGQFFNEVWQIIVDVCNGIWSTITEVWDSILYGIMTVLEAIITGIQETWDNIATAISTAMQSIWNIITSVWNMICEAIISIMHTIQSTIQSIWNMIWEIIQSIMYGIKKSITDAWDAIKYAIETIVNIILTIITNVWNAISNTISNIINTIYNVLSTTWNTISTTISTILNTIKNTVTTVWNNIKSTITTVVNSIKTFLTNTWNNIKDTITTVFNTIKTTITSTINTVKTFLSNTWNSIKSIISTTVNTIKSNVIDAFDNIKSSVKEIIDTLYTNISTIFNNMKRAITNAINAAKENVISAMKKAKEGMLNVFDNISSTFSDIGKNVIQGIVNGIGSMVSYLYESIKSALSGLVDKAKSALGINSPSRVFKEQIGVWLPPGIAEGFEKAMPGAIEDIEDSLNEGIDSIETNDIDTGNTNLDIQIDDFTEKYKQVFESLVIWFETMEERMATAIEGLMEYFEYLMYVRHIIGNDDDFKAFVFGESDDSDKRKKSVSTDSDVKNDSNTGDTFNFYSPKPIDEVQAARLLRSTKRDLAEGF